MSELNFSITNRTDGTLPIEGVPFIDIKESVLGSKYELSLVFVRDEYAQELNSKYRNKTYYPDILSFPLSDKSGEIFINLDAIDREHNDYERSVKNFIVFLFIHGIHHLKGMSHGSTMEQAEAEVRQKFEV